MFKISIVETASQRRLILEGRLISPWTTEVANAWRNATEQLEGRKLVVDLTNVTLIGVDGEETLSLLMREGAEFVCCGVLTKHLVKKLARACRCKT